MGLTRALAERIHGISAHDIPQAAFDWAKTAIIDTLGVTLGGSQEDAARIVLRVGGVGQGAGASLIFGTRKRTGMLDAVLANGVAGHALDYDDSSGVMGGHPSSPMVAPLLALAEERHAGGRDLLVAYIAGFETQVRLARGVNAHHYEKGWHPTATLGTFGATAASARLMNLSVEQTATALSIASSMAAGIKANFGTMTKPLHIGQSARNGLFATLLASEGFTASSGALEQRQGFLNIYNSPGNYDVDRILAGWQEPLEVQGPTVCLKPYPCCGSAHPAIDATLELVRSHDVQTGDISAIAVRMEPRRLLHLDKPRPVTGLEAKYSVQYVVARAAADRAVRLDHFEGSAVLEPRLRPVLDNVAASTDPTIGYGVEIVIDTHDGRRLSRRIEDANGLRRGPGGSPMSPEEIWVKFRDCAQRALPAAQVAELFSALGAMELEPDIGTLVNKLEPAQ